ncbi:ShlB/FhaC/HecB family hemolysin secretion/activation protein [Leptolyngbya sp. AN02str]|uniref:ShlB/FhaC/HecB family hemolysin secretion/activation protein n=1 Tax=Leptolyngbya sp. AN02str TaxID=3423363 RepID=UPI003D312C7F
MVFRCLLHLPTFFLLSIAAGIAAQVPTSVLAKTVTPNPAPKQALTWSLALNGAIADSTPVSPSLENALTEQRVQNFTEDPKLASGGVPFFADTPQVAQLPIDFQRPEPLPPQEPLPQTPLPSLPPPEQLLPRPDAPAIPPELGDGPSTTIRVNRFEVVGSTVFSAEELAEITAPYTNRDLSFAELLQVRTAITQHYVSQGYTTSGAFIPPQTPEDGVVRIQVLEGRVEDITITGNRRLRPAYVRSRLRLAAEAPLNVNQLLEGLQLLQLDPLIETISADLQAGVRPGTNVLDVEVQESRSFRLTPSLDNARSPSVGSFRRQLELSEANLLGFGDALSLSYSNTDGSNGIDASYTLPINPRNGTLRLGFGTTTSNVIEAPFNALDLQAVSRYYELSFRQPVAQSPTEEFALGVTFSRQESQTELGFDNIGPFPLSPGADSEGRSRISALRFFQEWTRRSRQEVLAFRSQVSLGLDLLNSTVNQDAPDSRFLAWRGQGQWVRVLAPDSLFLIRGDVQFADSALMPLEQFGLGGQSTVRGYRQDTLLSDNGALLSSEVRLPILRVNSVDGLLQLVPFIDVGVAWNQGNSDLDTNFIAGTGVGLLWQMGDRFSSRLDWGIPLVDVANQGNTWQGNGVYFSVRGSF